MYFDWCDSKAPSKGQSLGRAEFVICQNWKYGRLKKFFIYPSQQRDVKFAYFVNCNSTALRISSWTHKGIEEPEVWLSFYCKDHKGFGQRVYVPRNSK